MSGLESDASDQNDPLLELYRRATEPPQMPAYLGDPIDVARRRMEASRLKEDEAPALASCSMTIAKTWQDSRKLWKARILPGFAIAAAVTIVATLIWGVRNAPAPLPGNDTGPPVVVVDIPKRVLPVQIATAPKLKTNAMSFDLPDGRRGPVGAIEKAGQKYDGTLQIETTRTKALLFQIDADTTQFLGSFERGVDGTISARSFRGRLGESVGYDLFVVVLVDQANYNTVRDLASAITPDQRDELQRAAGQSSLEASVRATIRAALKNLNENWECPTEDILLFKLVEHSR